MDLLESIREAARAKRAKVALGVGWEREDYINNAVRSALRAVDKGFGEVVLVSKKGLVGGIQGLRLIESDEPWSTLPKLLRSGEVDAAIRGSLPAHEVVAAIKRTYGLKKLHRIALLESAHGQLFFLAPVGIDEGNTLSDKYALVKYAIKLHSLLGLNLKIAILSSGRLEDFGRGRRVDKMLCEGELLASLIKRDKLATEVRHYGILIEDAIADGASFVLAPDGISGNLIFRTLEFLGGGRGVAAVYADVLPTVFLDVSRAMKDYVDAIALASALTKWAAGYA